MTTRQSTVKTILWAIAGVLVTVTLARFLRGLGATTGLSDAAPWGFWIAFDVMAGVALAAGGFVLAGTVYIFGLERYRSFVRPAVLTAFLGYAAVATGLMYDLGLPWNIWHPIVYPQHHSVLFEVAMCVMLYLTVLGLEFSPVVLEHPLFDRPLFQTIYKILKKVTIPLVITGIVLSTLHQSSLGSLFLITPYRLHPLWYSPIIWILFLISAVGLGLMMVTLESLFSAWFFGHKIRMDLLSGLGKAASIVLFLYAGIRLIDLAVRGVLGTAFDGSPQSMLFLFEILVSALIPATLLAIPQVRASVRGVGTAAVMTVLGMIGYRFDTCIVAFQRPDGMSYFPTWTEVAVSVGIVAGAMLVFLFFVEHLKVYPEEHEEEAPGAGARKQRAYEAGSMWNFSPDALSAPRRYSLVLILGIVVAMAFLPEGTLFGARPYLTPVQDPLTVDGLMRTRVGAPGHDIAMVRSGDAVPSEAKRVPMMLIDGNRDGRLVQFLHDWHKATLGGEDSCKVCHHQNLPFQKNSKCYQCHRDMYVETDIFSHSSHITKLKGNEGCVRCHKDSEQVKSRQTAVPCLDCHKEMVTEGSRIKLPEAGMTGLAAGYMDAMHGLCVKCHEQKVKEDAQKYGAAFAGCLNCHRDVDGSQLRQMAPYVVKAKP